MNVHHVYLICMFLMLLDKLAESLPCKKHCGHGHGHGGCGCGGGYGRLGGFGRFGGGHGYSFTGGYSHGGGGCSFCGGSGCSACNGGSQLGRIYEYPSTSHAAPITTYAPTPFSSGSGIDKVTVNIINPHPHSSYDTARTHAEPYGSYTPPRSYEAPKSYHGSASSPPLVPISTSTSTFITAPCSSCGKNMSCVCS